MLHVESVHAANRSVRLCVPAALIFCAAACAKTAPQSPPASGRVTIGVTSRGPGVDTMTFTVSIEPAGVEGSVRGDVGVYTASDNPAGNHVVRLKDLPGRCRIDGESDRKIRVSAGGSTTVRFAVVCI
jgi:hypothetical protein